MAFTGTLDKCKACDKTVYQMELLSVDGVSYHKYCFKCSRCRSTLVMSNYSSMEGVLYCKPHFEQLFKETGTFSKGFNLPPKSQEKAEQGRLPNRFSSVFTGTQDKCATCNRTAYPIEKVTVEGQSYHKQCFRCSYGGCTITPLTYASHDGILYCNYHFARLFKEKGDFKHVIQSVTTKSNTTEVSDEAEKQE